MDGQLGGLWFLLAGATQNSGSPIPICFPPATLDSLEYSSFFTCVIGRDDIYLTMYVSHFRMIVYNFESVLICRVMLNYVADIRMKGSYSFSSSSVENTFRFVSAQSKNLSWSSMTQANLHCSVCFFYILHFFLIPGEESSYSSDVQSNNRCNC
jgi:hypothetical protein